MKTVIWKKYAETYYLPMQEDNLTTMPELDYSGVYVLASEANERIRKLEAELDDRIQNLLKLTSKLTTERDELEAEIKDLNIELQLANARNQLNPLPGDNMIHDEAEIRRMYAVAREAKEHAERLEAEIATTKADLLLSHDHVGRLQKELAQGRKDNTYVSPSGTRTCIKCRTLYKREWRKNGHK
jgi:predicted RNase H-like nuclease (RuvC/YqgF family)